MKSVVKYELLSYFTNIPGDVFGAFILLFAGIYTTVNNLKAGSMNFEYVLQGMSFIFLIAVPVLTMRVLAEERSQRTDTLLYSLPASMTKVILGKYIAMLVMFLIPLFIISLYPLMLTAFGNAYLVVSLSALLGFFFLGASLIAIGMFISSLTSSQAVAAGACFVVMLVNYYMASLSGYVSEKPYASLIALMILVLLVAGLFFLLTKNIPVTAVIGGAAEAALLIVFLVKSSLFEGLFGKLLESLSLFKRFDPFVEGMFDLTGILYYVSVIVFFLALSILSMEKQRWAE